MVASAPETTFPKSARLLVAADYQRVFGTDKPLRVSIPEILVLASPNQLQHPRLGLVVAKKHLRRAVHRNRFKRVIRDCFRLQQHRLGGLDIIVLVRRGAQRLNRDELTPQVERLFEQLIRKAGR